ncbi:hypothetical protein TanjilG_06180 [Lupinus angustifolius]|uniref:Uncharacterized protein n=1 Tax=Lupinus angustifolius TaxID=3871 RepID=A0A1J7G2N1_LUPAN|nr:hypothetical protein TanjilG_06180 [Lupinus angustifolius]
MANPTAATKFASVNLNKSYGQHSSSYGSNRNRANVNGGGGGGGGGGGMVVLSRPRRSAAGTAGAAGSGSGLRPPSSSMGWTKPATIALQEKQHLVADLPAVDGFSRGSSVYIPPSAPPQPIVEKAIVLRGEDFPSLKAATLSSSSLTPHKPKEAFNNKHKQFGSDSLSTEQKEVSGSSSLVDVGNSLSVNGYQRPSSLGGSRASQQGRKQEEYFPAPLPLVQLKPRSDWADDERDSSHGFTDRSRDHGFSRNDAYGERDFDFPRTASREGRKGSFWRNSSFQKDGFVVQDAANVRNDTGTQHSTMNIEVGHDDKYVPSHFRDNAAHDYPGKMVMGYGQGGKHPWNNSTELYSGRRSERNAWDRAAGNEQQSRNRVDSFQISMLSSSFSLGGKGLPVNDPLLSFGREKRPFPKNEKSFLVDPFTNDFGASGFDGGDILSAGIVGVVKKKKDALKQIDFHDRVRESFEAELERVQRIQEQERQKIIEEQERPLEFARREEEERLKQAREQERKRRLEEEAREAACQAEQERIGSLRKAEELRLSKEEEKRRTNLEEERRKQATKQKNLELEQRIARRQTEAVKGDTHSPVPVDERIRGFVKEKDSSWATDISDWDESERIVERIITSVSSDSSSVNRLLDTGSRLHFSRDTSSNFVDRGKTVNLWRNAYDNGSSHAPYMQEHDNVNNSYGPHRDSSLVGKPSTRKGYYGGAGFMSSRNHNKGGLSDSRLDEYAHLHGQRCNKSGDGDRFGRNTEIDSDFHENFVDRFGDGWSQSRSHDNPFSPYPECSDPNIESDGPYTYLGRSPYSPPSSRTHLSHDDLDGSGDSPVKLISEESINDALSALDNESIVINVRAQNVNAVVSSSAVSTADDEEWTNENNEQFQNRKNMMRMKIIRKMKCMIILTSTKFEDMQLEEKGSPHMMENLVLGFDEGVQVGMPNVEFERTSKDGKTTFMAPQDSINSLDVHVSFDNACNDGKAPRAVFYSSQLNLNSSCRVFEDSEKPTQDSVIQPINSHPSIASASAGNVCPTVSTSGAIAPHSSVGPNVVPNVVAPSQAELPIKLQFGLFAGPSLIPSPVPSIQIGSIQMPLPLHPLVGAPFSHMHPSLGIMPLGPQAMSFAQPNIASELSFNHSHGGQMSVHDGPDDRFVKNETRPYSLDSQPGTSRHLSQASWPSENAENIDGPKQGTNSTRIATGFRVDKQRSQNSAGNTSSTAYESNGQQLARDASIHSIPKEKEFMYSKAHHPVSGGRGKRHAFSVKTPGSRSSGLAVINRSDSRGFLRRPRMNVQHTEFRVRETAKKSQSSSLVLSDQFGSDNNSNINGRKNSHQIDSGCRAVKVDGNESTKTQSTSHFGHSNLKRTMCSEEDVAPLQSGVIRVFEQPGIEAPSDEDDFIEVRSKRQMLNDRREQMEREMKAKSQSAKMPQRSRSTAQNAAALANYSRGSISTGEMANGVHAHLVAEEGRKMAKINVSSVFDSSLSSQPLAPIGTPPLRIGAHSDLRSQTSRPLKTSLLVVLGGGKGSGPVVDDGQASLGSRGNVMALTQTQLDEAMKAQQFDSHASVGELKSAVSNSCLPTSSILSKEKASPSASSPINSLLVGEKIEFEKYKNESHGQLEGCEAEAAASAVAVAAISNDEIVGNGLGAASEQQSITGSKSGEPLSVSLPADLSVDTPTISFWSPLQNQQNLSSHMISHVPVGPPHFPFYERNHMMSGRPVFAFGPNDEFAAAAQSQPQNSNTSVSGPTGSWHQCLSSVDSFYGPPTRFTGPFITPPGGIPGVQGPPHMIVYNHFAPVGQFGQVGLSFLGTTYIPTGKQPDWKHTPTSSAIESEGDNNVNMVTSQGNPYNMPSPIHHLAPGSPLLPTYSPQTLFDVPPFQSPDMTVQVRWPHVPNSNVPSIPPQSVPSLQERVNASHYSHVPSLDQPLNSNRFSSSQTSTSDVGINYPTASDANVNQLPNELGLVDHSYSTACKVTAPSVVNKNQSANAHAHVHNDNGGNSNNQNANSAVKNQPS